MLPLSSLSFLSKPKPSKQGRVQYCLEEKNIRAINIEMDSSSLFEASQASSQRLQKEFNNIVRIYMDHVKSICHYYYIITGPPTLDKPDLTI